MGEDRDARQMTGAMAEKRFDTESGTIRYWTKRSNSANAPWIVFLPGLTADHRLFNDQMKHFGAETNCLVWDPPAHGASRPFLLDFSMDDLAEMLREILSVEGIEHPVLVGQSMGGYVAQAYMDLHPGSLLGFVSIDSAPLKRRYMKRWEIAALRHTRLMYLSIPWKLLVSWGSKGTSETERGRTLMAEMMRSYDKREYVNLAAHGYRLLADAVAADRAYLIDCPALLLCGEHDAAGSAKAYNERWAAAEGLPLVWVEGAGHNSNVDAPDFVNRVIEEFVASLDPWASSPHYPADRQPAPKVFTFVRL